MKADFWGLVHCRYLSIHRWTTTAFIDASVSVSTAALSYRNIIWATYAILFFKLFFIKKFIFLLSIVYLQCCVNYCHKVIHLYIYILSSFLNILFPLWFSIGYFQVSRCRLLYIEWIKEKVLLYSTENYIQCPMINIYNLKSSYSPIKKLKEIGKINFKNIFYLTQVTANNIILTCKSG